MREVFRLNYERLSDLPQGGEFGRALDALSPIDSPSSFNRYCREACRLWREKFPEGRGHTSPHFAELLSQIAEGGEKVIPTGWGGVVITRHKHPQVEKFLVVRHGGQNRILIDVGKLDRQAHGRQQGVLPLGKARVDPAQALGEA